MEGWVMGQANAHVTLKIKIKIIRVGYAPKLFPI